MYLFFQTTINGLATGALYALIAVGFSLTYMTTRTLNFALGMWVMLGSMLTFALHVQAGLHPVLVFPIVALALYLLAIPVERVAVYPFLRAGSQLWVMSTLAVGLLLIDVVEIVWGRSQHAVPSFIGDGAFHIGVISIRPEYVLALVVAALTFLALDIFYRHTLLGKAYRAVAHSPRVASLLGINTRVIEKNSFALAAALAGIAGFLIAPISGAEAHSGTGLGFKAFAIAIIAGLSAPRGILIFALLYGVLEGLISAYLNTGVRDIIGFSLMILALSLRPEGLFGVSEEERA